MDVSIYSHAPGPSSSENSLRSGNRRRHRSGSPPRNSGTDPAGSLNPAIGVRLPAELPTLQPRGTAECNLRSGPICAHVPFSLSSMWVQWSPHPGPGFPTFAGIFEFAIRYFALERCFPFLAGTLFILLSLEVPRYHRHAFGSSTNGDNPVPAFIEPPARPPPTRSVPAPTIASFGFLLSHHANIERIPPI